MVNNLAREGKRAQTWLCADISYRTETGYAASLESSFDLF